MSGKVYVGDTGTEIVLDCGADISNATAVQILVRKPSGQVLTWAASLSGSNHVRYVVQAGDLDQSGLWTLQARVTTPTWSGRGEAFELRVWPQFK